MQKLTGFINSDCCLRVFISQQSQAVRQPCMLATRANLEPAVGLTCVSGKKMHPSEKTENYKKKKKIKETTASRSNTSDL